MGNFWFGLKALFQIWTDTAFAEHVRALTIGQAAGEKPVAAVIQPKAPIRSEALTLLSVLQREGRFVDFIKEPIAAYTDAQVGAAVRGVHEDCGKALERLFSIQPLRSENEGEQVTIPSGFDPGQVRLVGGVPEQGPFKGALQHPGWRASKAVLPDWNGQEDSALVIAPCEVEIK